MRSSIAARLPSLATIIYLPAVQHVVEWRAEHYSTQAPNIYLNKASLYSAIRSHHRIVIIFDIVVIIIVIIVILIIVVVSIVIIIILVIAILPCFIRREVLRPNTLRAGTYEQLQ